MGFFNDTLSGLVSRSIRALVLMIAGLFALLAAYPAAATVGTVWTSGTAAATGSGDTRTVYILSNGFHSDIALPVEQGRPVAGLPIAAADFPGGLRDSRYLIVGWGSQTAYTRLLALSDLTPDIALKALLFDRSVMHVLPYAGDLRGPHAYRVELDKDQYERLLTFVAGTFATDGDGTARPLPNVTHGFGDVFYRAGPRFSLFYGCNAWTGAALRRAGVPVGRWTPFAQSIEWNLRGYAG